MDVYGISASNANTSNPYAAPANSAVQAISVDDQAASDQVARYFREYGTQRPSYGESNGAVDTIGQGFTPKGTGQRNAVRDVNTVQDKNGNYVADVILGTDNRLYLHPNPSAQTTNSVGGSVGVGVASGSESRNYPADAPYVLLTSSRQLPDGARVNAVDRNRDLLIPGRPTSARDSYLAKHPEDQIIGGQRNGGSGPVDDLQRAGQWLWDNTLGGNPAY